ncbi:MAG: LexA family transcriptional regulator [Clostridia bacterium]|nr:LexA family transcriptional regulator [Clostridia bacterium]MBQ7659841.1 LexA family transcriptional regulator [Alphaproteobacteria bacterium]
MNIIKKMREEKKLSQSELGRLIGVSQQHIQRFEGGYPVPNKYIPKLVKILNIDIKELLPEELKDYTPVQEDVVSIDILDIKACCGNGVENFTENVIGKHMMSLPALRELTQSLPENIKIIKAIGESMVPTIYPNDVVWIDVSVKEPTSDGLYAIIVGSELMIKRIQINPFDNSATIISDNQQYANFKQNDYKNIRVVGKVIYHMKRMS